MDLIAHYNNLLEMGMLRQDGVGMIHERAAGKKITNLFVHSKPVVMPIYSQLASADISERLVFHPFAESAAKGESLIVSELRQRFCTNITNRMAAFFMRCIMLASSRAEHSKLNPVQGEMLDALRKIEEKHGAAIGKLMQKILKHPDKKNISLIQIYLTRNGKVGGSEFARAGIVSFPLYTAVVAELDKTKERVIDGQPFSEKELQYIKGLYEYVFPMLLTDPAAYNRGSNSDVAPYMDALMKTTAAVTVMLNEKINLFSEIFNTDTDKEEGAGLNPLPEDWMSAIDELGGLLPEIIKIPLQPGMDGQPKVSEALASANQMATAAPVQQAPPQPQYPQHPVYAPVPAGYYPTQVAPAPVVQMNPYQQQPIYQAPPQQAYYPNQPPVYGQQPYYGGPQPVYGQQPIQNANVNLNPYHVNQQSPMGVASPLAKGMWD